MLARTQRKIQVVPYARRASSIKHQREVSHVQFLECRKCQIDFSLLFTRETFLIFIMIRNVKILRNFVIFKIVRNTFLSHLKFWIVLTFKTPGNIRTSFWTPYFQVTTLILPYLAAMRWKHNFTMCLGLCEMLEIKSKVVSTFDPLGNLRF